MADGIKIDVTVNGAQAEQAIKKLEAAINGFAKQSTENIKKTTNAFDVFKGTFAAGLALKGLDLAKQGLSELIGFIGQGVDKAIQQQDAINKLNTALIQSGKFTKQSADSFIEWAGSLENASKFSGELIQTSAAVLQSMTKLSDNGLRQATQAAIELASTFNIDLETATRAVGKAANGEVGALQKFGIEVKKGKADAETFANALNTLSQFSGNAAASLLTFSGSTSRLNNSFDNVQKSLGKIIIENPAVIKSIALMGEGFVFLDKIIKENATTISNFISGTIQNLATALQVTLEVIDPFARAMVANWNLIAVGVQTGVGVIVGQFRLMLGVINTIIEKVTGLASPFKGFTEKVQNLFEVLVGSVKEDAGDIADSLSKFGAHSKAADVVANASVRITTAVNEEAAAYAAAAKAADDAAKKKMELAANAPPVVDEQTRKDIDAERNKHIEIAAIRQQAALEQEEFEINRRILAEEQTIADMERLKAIELEKSTIMLDADAQRNALLDSSRAQKAEADKLAAQKEAVLRKTANDQELKQIKQNQTDKKNQMDAGLSATSNFLQAGLLLAKQGSREQKALAIADATINTYKAANVALANPAGPPFTYALVASTIALGLAQVAKITSAGSFEQGGFVTASPSTPMRGDNVLARVNPGEFIANRNQQQNIIEAVANGGALGSATDLKSVLSDLVSSMMNQPVVVSIDGREIARATRNQIQNGFRLAV